MPTLADPGDAPSPLTPSELQTRKALAIDAYLEASQATLQDHATRLEEEIGQQWRSLARRAIVSPVSCDACLASCESEAAHRPG
jgi:hypothetical protein